MIEQNSRIGVRQYVGFVAVVTLAHVITYLIAGTLSYELIYKSAIESGSFDDSMRSQSNSAEWQHVEMWLIPGQVLRGVLFGAALCPLLSTLASWRFHQRFAVLLGLLLVFSVWSVTMPGPGSIEGWIYLKPDSGSQIANPFLGFIEVPLQLAAFSLIVAWRMGKTGGRTRGALPE